MAQSLSIQIALAGGDLVAKQLADIGAAGQKAFADIAQAADQAGGFKSLDPSVVTDKLKEMGVTGVDEINKIQAAVQKAAMFEKLAQGIQTAESALKAFGITASISLGGIAAAIGAIIPLMLKWAGAIEDANVQATKMGETITQFSALQQAFEKAGVGAKGVADAMDKIGAAAEKAQITAVTKAFTDLQSAAQRGFGAVGTTQLQTLQTAAAGVGKAAELARQDLEKLDQPLPTDAPQTLEQFIEKLGDVNQATAAFVNELAQMPAGVQRNQFALDQLGQAGLQLSQAFARGAITANQFKQGMQALITPAAVANAEALTEATTQLGQAWQELTSGSGGAANQIANLLNFLTQLIHAAEGLAQIAQFFDNIEASVQRAGAAMREFFSGLNWDIIDAGVNAWNALTGAIGSAVQALQQFLGLQPQGGGSISNLPPEGMAGGGLIGGSGTGTSDSNLAWVSRGEHIMPAAAVAQPGVLAFLEALRRSGGNLAGVLDGLGRFAMGGLVPRPAMAFAAGGLVGMHAVTINFPGLPPISGLRATSVVVDELNRAAVLAQVRSGGRKPSRYT